MTTLTGTMTLTEVPPTPETVARRALKIEQKNLRSVRRSRKGTLKLMTQKTPVIAAAYALSLPRYDEEEAKTLLRIADLKRRI